MRTQVIGKKTRVWLTYIEFTKNKNALPQVSPMVIGGSTEYIITHVPEDKVEFFEKSGFNFRRILNKGRGLKKW